MPAMICGKQNGGGDEGMECVVVMSRCSFLAVAAAPDAVGLANQSCRNSFYMPKKPMPDPSLFSL